MASEGFVLQRNTLVELLVW